MLFLYTVPKADPLHQKTKSASSKHFGHPVTNSRCLGNRHSFRQNNEVTKNVFLPKLLFVFFVGNRQNFQNFQPNLKRLKQF